MDKTTPDLVEQAAGDAPGPVLVGERRNISVGTASWTDKSLLDTKAFYPRGCNSAEQRLRFYASQFPMVEVDSSFFAMPSAKNSELWAERTPSDFRFNVKAFRALTGHQTPPASFPRDIQEVLPPLAGRRKNWYYKDLPDEIRDELWRRFKQAVEPLRAAGRLRALHFQFAPWVTGAPEWKAHVEECVARMDGYLLAVEFRNQTWFGEGRVEDTLAWEQALGVTHVVVDEPQGVGNYAQGVWAVTNPNLAVVRLHGRNEETWNAKGLSASSERFNYEYSDEELAGIAERTRKLADEAFEVQVVVNVNYEMQGIHAARRMQQLMLF